MWLEHLVKEGLENREECSWKELEQERKWFFLHSSKGRAEP